MKFDLWMMLKYYILGHLKIESSNTNLKPSPLCEYICEWKKSIISPTKTRKKERKKADGNKNREGRERLGICTLICSGEKRINAVCVLRFRRQGKGPVERWLELEVRNVWPSAGVVCLAVARLEMPGSGLWLGVVWATALLDGRLRRWE